MGSMTKIPIAECHSELVSVSHTALQYYFAQLNGTLK